jgi:hypothetical protein
MAKDTPEWRKERWPVGLDYLGHDSLELWPEIPEEIEPRVAKVRNVQKWMQAIGRDAYTYGSFVLKNPEAWMVYKASLAWHREANACAEDFLDPDDPEGVTSMRTAESLAQASRRNARTKLAWLGSRIAAKVAAEEPDKFFPALAKITKEMREFPQPPSKFDPETGAWKEWIRCPPQEGLIVNAIYAIAGRGATFHLKQPIGPVHTPTIREILEFLEAKGFQTTPRDIRRAAKKYGLATAEGPTGRPRKG